MAMLPQYLLEIQQHIEQIARDYGLDMFEQWYEMVDYKTMNEVAAYGGFPTRYPHWRFGMEYEKLSKGYEYGMQKIYELVINNDPCYGYLLEGNSLVDQKMVIAHVCGHNDFFKNNYFFSKTNRRMIDQMANHATRIRRYMDKFGSDRVENFIDVCLSLDNLIDPMSMFIQRRREDDDEEGLAEDPNSGNDGKFKAKSYMDSYINPIKSEDDLQDDLLETEEDKLETPPMEDAPRIPAEPMRDVLLFLIENAPLESWQRVILRIIRREAYYFAPQGMTKIMNEGWATYWHSTMMTRDIVDASEIIDYAECCAGVLGGGMPLNPYKIGLELFRYIEDRWNKGRFGPEWDNCTNLEERKKWDKQLGLGREKIFQVRSLYNDVTFIDEFFTEDFCREQLYYSYGWNEQNDQWEIQSKQFSDVKNQLLNMVTNFGQPVIHVEDGNFGNRSELLLVHRHEGVDLRQDWAQANLENLYRVWHRPVNLQTIVNEESKILHFDGNDHSIKPGPSL